MTDLPFTAPQHDLGADGYRACPIEAVLGPGDEHRYPCQFPKGHDGRHSFLGRPNPPSVADLTTATIPKRQEDR